MASNRVFYACQSVALTDSDGTNPAILEGVQSVGLNSSFNFEQVFELGHIEIYENIEGIPEVEASLERVLDGEPTLYQRFGTQTAGDPGASLLAVGDGQKGLQLSLFDDSGDSNGAVTAGVLATGLFVSNYSISINLDGPSTESMTLVGNHKIWDGGDAGNVPKTNAPATAVMKRQSLNTAESSIPNGAERLQSITISVDFGREDLNQLGDKYPFFKAATYPTEVTSEFTYLMEDTTHASSSSDPTIFGLGGDDEQKNKDVTQKETIKIVLNSIRPADGVAQTSAGNVYEFDLGANNRLTGVSLSGGDAGGGNSTVTYSFSTYNELLSRNTTAT